MTQPSPNTLDTVLRYLDRAIAQLLPEGGAEPAAAAVQQATGYVVRAQVLLAHLINAGEREL